MTAACLNKKPGLNERRAERRRKSAARSDKYWAGELAAAQGPIKLFDAHRDLLRTRMVQRLERAERSLARARAANKPRWIAKAEEQLTAARAEVEADVARLTALMIELAEKHQVTRV